MEEKKFYTMVRGGRDNKKPSKPESEYRAVSRIDNMTPLDGDGFKKVVGAILDNDTFGFAPIVLAFAAGCYLRPHFNESGVPFHNLTVAAAEWSDSALEYRKILKALFATESELSARDATYTRIMYHASSSDFVPLIVYGYDEYFTAPRSRRNEIVMGMRAVFNRGRAPIGQPDLSFKEYRFESPGALFCRTPPNDRGRWRSILIELPDWEYKNVAWTTEKTAGIESLGATLYQAAKELSAKDVRFVYDSQYKYLRKRLGHFEAEQIADLSTGLWFLGLTAERLGTRFESVSGVGKDAMEERIIHSVNLEGIE